MLLALGVAMPARSTAAAQASAADPDGDAPRLRSFAKRRLASSGRFAYGILLQALGQFALAADQFTKVVQVDPEGAYAKEAARLSVLARQWVLGIHLTFRRYVDASEEREKLRSAPRLIPAGQRAMIDAYEAYLRYLPGGAERSTLKCGQALIFFDFNHFDEALKRFEEVVRATGQDLSDLSAAFASGFVIELLAAQGRPKEVGEWMEFLEVPSRYRGGHLADAYENQGWASKDRRHFGDCGDSMLAAAAAAPDDERHAVRLSEAATCFFKAQLPMRAFQAQLILKQSHPDWLGRHLTWQIAVRYHSLAYFSKAAEYYEEFAARYPRDPRAGWALRNAATFRIGLGEGDKAVRDLPPAFIGCVQRHPRDAAAVYFNMADLYEREKRFDTVAKQLESYLEKWRSKGGRDREVLAHFRLGTLAWDASCRVRSAVGACERDARRVAGARLHFEAAVNAWSAHAASSVKGGDVEARVSAALDARAGALFYLAEGRYEEYLRLRGGERTSRIVGVRASFSRVFDLRREPWAIAAAARMGQVDETLRSSRTEAINTFEKCVSTATAEAWHGEWSRVCESALNRLAPAQHPLTSEITPDAGYTPTQMSWTPVIPRLGRTPSVQAQ